MTTVTIDKPGTIDDVVKRLNRPPEKMTIDLTTITPEVAQLLLGLNDHNRPLRQNNIKKHIATMDRGRWVQTGDPIRISKPDEDGKIHLIDGQNKLSAMSQGGHTYDYLVIWGLEEASQDFIDTGSKRSLSHALSLKGEQNPNSLGGAVRLIWQVENGGTPAKWIEEPTYAEYYEYIDDDIRTATAVGIEVARTLKVPASPVAAAYQAIQQNMPAKGDPAPAEFFTDLYNMNASLEDGSPILALRYAMVKWASRGSVSRMEQASLYDVIIRAFTDWADGVPVKSYRLTKRPRTYRLP